MQVELARRLSNQFAVNYRPDWPWLEDSLTYANARLPHALLLASLDLDDLKMRDQGLEALGWLMDLQIGRDDEFAPIGSDGFYEKGGIRSYFDQQPIEAWSSMSACFVAHRITRNHNWLTHANRSFEWFLGGNMLNQPVLNSATGGCHDGLHEDRMNRNQGAESTLSYLCALAELRSQTTIANEN
jgi:hypothetical protein